MTYALITLYHPDVTVLDHVRTIAGQVDKVFLCDNSGRSNRSLFEPLLDRGEYVCFGENLGLSRAFNRVLKDPSYGWKSGDYILFFDQDSQLEPGHVAGLIGTYEAAGQAGHAVGCIGPVYYNTSSGAVEVPKMKQLLTDRVYRVSSIITSSMLTTYGVLEQVGFWNEKVFLDMADWDLCWRMTAAGLYCCLTDAVVLHHSVGRGEKRIGPLRLRVGAPFREYYQIRDCLYLLGERYTPLKYRVRFLAMVFVRSPLHVIFLDDHKARLNYIRMGLRAHRKGETGALPEPQKTAVP